MEDKIYAVTVLTVLTVFFGYRKKSARIKLYELIKNPVWMINFIVIMCFIAYIHFIELPNIKDNEKKERLAESMKRAIIALIIAVLAELNLSIAPFWVVFVFSYFMHDWM
tara:strand:+ start:176 stop:505 length:330 start_codon:yes stop_codon:yes gene_type:complete